MYLSTELNSMTIPHKCYLIEEYILTPSKNEY